ncbi:MAG TPA: DUF5985 family protein [Polyangiaceae bacterium]|nr:DUF5985 family protein [Polyangiaceae bacterium]
MQFVWGALTSCCLVAGLSFLRFWKSTQDRLFLFLAGGFGALAVNWVVISLSDPTAEGHHRVYVVRLVAFGIIILGVLDKNRRHGRTGSP